MASPEGTPAAYQPDSGAPPIAPYGAPAAYPGYGPAMPPAPPPTTHSGHVWVWWLLGIIIVLMFIGGTWAGIAAIAGGSSGIVDGDTIAVIPLDGAISGSGDGGVVTPEAFRSLLRRAEDDDAVKAVVLRVNSPGGTVAASEEIATYVKKLSKPVVVSVGDMDASGAYMISSQADKIVALPGSAVGSIGVIMEVPNAAGLLGKIGVQFKVLTAGKYKDAGSPYRALSSTETAMLQDQIDEVYGQFIDIVASGRHLPRSQVESMATGWAWTGTRAKTMGLVDQVGTYDDALKAAAKLGGIHGGQYHTDVYNESQLSGILSALLGIESQLRAISANNPVNPASVSGATLAR
jgi:protease IV